MLKDTKTNTRGKLLLQERKALQEGQKDYKTEKNVTRAKKVLQYTKQKYWKKRQDNKLKQNEIDKHSSNQNKVNKSPYESLTSHPHTAIYSLTHT